MSPLTIISEMIILSLPSLMADGIFLSLWQNQMVQTVIWMDCLNRKKWKSIHITMLINFHRQGSIIPVLPISVPRGKNLYVGTSRPLGQAK